MKFEWRDREWSKARFPIRQHDHLLFRELIVGDVIMASIQQFKMYPGAFYARLWIKKLDERSGPLGSLKEAEAWCEKRVKERLDR